MKIVEVTYGTQDRDKKGRKYAYIVDDKVKKGDMIFPAVQHYRSGNIFGTTGVVQGAYSETSRIGQEVKSEAKSKINYRGENVELINQSSYRETVKQEENYLTNLPVEERRKMTAQQLQEASLGTNRKAGETDANGWLKVSEDNRQYGKPSTSPYANAVENSRKTNVSQAQTQYEAIRQRQSNDTAEDYMSKYLK